MKSFQQINQGKIHKFYHFQLVVIPLDMNILVGFLNTIYMLEYV